MSLLARDGRVLPQKDMGDDKTPVKLSLPLVCHDRVVLGSSC